MRFKYKTPDPHLYKTLLSCYERCLKNKRHVKKSLFHLHHEIHINQLALDIQHNTYKPFKSSVFVILHPKPREVVAANLRDRIVHHYIYQYMESYWEKRFASASYACRPGKGPLKATMDLRRFITAHRRSTSGRPLWYLKVDVSSFFPSIDKNILFSIIKRHLKNRNMLNLCEVTLFHNPMKKGNFVLTCPKEYWQLLPKHKSLFYAKEGKGLPIGNLSSQFWANIYMNVFDQWVTRTFKNKVLYWQRYVDDSVFLSEDKKTLQKMPQMIDEFLHRHLDLRLNPRKTILQSLSKGLDHLGYFHKPDRMTVRRSSALLAKGKLKEALNHAIMMEDVEKLCSTIGSNFGYFRNADSYQLRRRFVSFMRDPYWGERLVIDKDLRRIASLKKKVEAIEELETDQKLQELFLRDYIPSPWEKMPYEASLNYLLGWRSLGDIARRISP